MRPFWLLSHVCGSNGDRFQALLRKVRFHMHTAHQPCFSERVDWGVPIPRTHCSMLISAPPGTIANQSEGASVKTVLRGIGVLAIAGSLQIVPSAMPSATAATATCTKIVVKTATNGIPIGIPASSSGSEKCVLSASSTRRDSVTWLQFALSECYALLPNSGVDGIYGPKTTAAVKKLQQRVGVAADGVYGPKTHNAMKFTPAESNGAACGYSKTKV